MYHIKITLQGHTRLHVNHTQQRKTTHNNAKPHGTMPNHAKPSQTTHNYYWEHIESFLTRIKKNTLKKCSGKEERR